MNTFLTQPLRRLRRAAVLAFGLAIGVGAFAGPAGANGSAGEATGSSFWTEPSGAAALSRMTPVHGLAKPLGDVTADGAVEKVHHRYRRGLFLYPRFYRRAWHGYRYRYARGPYRYAYHGWYYRRPWWLVNSYSPRYPRRAYYYRNYAVPHGGRCDYWARQCSRNWGRRNANFYGCMRYHRCR